MEKNQMIKRIAAIVLVFTMILGCVNVPALAEFYGENPPYEDIASEEGQEETAEGESETAAEEESETTAEGELETTAEEGSETTAEGESETIVEEESKTAAEEVPAATDIKPEKNLADELPAPQIISAIPGNGQVELQWETDEEIESASGYMIQWSASKDFEAKEYEAPGEDYVEASGQDEYTYTVENLENNQTYWFRVRAVNMEEEIYGPFSKAVEVTLIPAVMLRRLSDDGDVHERLEFKIRYAKRGFEEKAYTEESWENLKSAIEDADGALKEEDATEMKDALETLDSAISSLEGIPGIITVFAGGNYTDEKGKDYLGNKILAQDTFLKGLTNGIEAIAFDNEDNLYFADQGSHVVRMVPKADGIYFGQWMYAGYIYTIAGTGKQAAQRNADDIPLTGQKNEEIKLNSPNAIAVDGDGNVYITDRTGRFTRLLMIAAKDGEYFGKERQEGYIYTLVQGPDKFNSVSDIVVDDENNLFIADTAQFRVLELENSEEQPKLIAGGGSEDVVDGADAVSVKIPTHVRSIAVLDGQLYVSASDNTSVKGGIIYQVDLASGKISVLAGSDKAENRKYSGDGGDLEEANFIEPYGMRFDKDGNLFIYDSSRQDGNAVIRMVQPEGGEISSSSKIYTVFGGKGNTGAGTDQADQGGKAVYAQGRKKVGKVAIDSENNIFFIQAYDDTGNSSKVLRIQEPSKAPVIAELKMTVEGDIPWTGGEDETIDLSQYVSFQATDQFGEPFDMDAMESPYQWELIDDGGGIAKLKDHIKLVVNGMGEIAIKGSINGNESEPETLEIYDHKIPRLYSITLSGDPALVYQSDFQKQALNEILTVQGYDQMGNKFPVSSELEWEVRFGSAVITGGEIRLTGNDSVGVAAKQGNVVSNIQIITKKKASTLSRITKKDKALFEDKIPASEASTSSDGYARPVFDEEGNILVSDFRGKGIRLVPVRDYDSLYGLSDLKANYIYTVAGQYQKENRDAPPEGSIAHEVGFSSPRALAIAPYGGFYFLDSYDSGNNHNRLYHVDENGILSYVAGDGTPGTRLPGGGDINTHNGSGGPALEAKFLTSYGISVDYAGNIYISENRTNTVRVIPAKDYTGDDKLYGLSDLKKGYIYVIAGNGKFNDKKAPSTQGSDIRQTEVKDYGDGPAFDSKGNMYVSDNSNKRIIKVYPDGSFINLIGDGTEGKTGIDIDNKPVSPLFPLWSMAGVTVDAADNIYFNEFKSGNPVSVYMIPSADGDYHGRFMKKGYVYRIAGGKASTGVREDGGLAAGWNFRPGASLHMAANGAGELAILDSDNELLYLKTAPFLHTLELTAAKSADAQIPLKINRGESVNLSNMQIGNSHMQVKGYDLSGEEFDLSDVDIQWEVAGGPGKVASDGKTLSIEKNGTLELRAMAYSKDGIASNTIRVAASVSGGYSSESSDDSDGSDQGGTKSSPMESINQQRSKRAIESALAKGNAPVITIGQKEKGVVIGGEQLIASQQQSKPVILQNQGSQLTLSPGLIKGLGLKEGSSVEIIFTPLLSVMNPQTAANLTNIDPLNETLAGKRMELDIRVDGLPVKRLSEPERVTVDISQLNLTAQQLAGLTGIVYDSNGNILQKLGGELSADGKSFTYCTYHSGVMGVIISNDLKRVQWKIGDSQYLINGLAASGSTAPVTVEDKILMPLKSVAEALEAKTDWDEATQTMSITRDGKTLSLKTGDQLPDGLGTAVMMNGHIFVPMQYITEQLGANAVWEEASKQVLIYR
ncbi:MAG: stalk domain-containing protein [Lacrimispora sp.]|uniref:stalk domain-containing protein n=1 Tax=Lacrimispora sp. TaxID=2719234 RepID=UPI0039E3B007